MLLETPPIMYQTSTARILPAQKGPTAVLLKPLNMRLIKLEITRDIFISWIIRIFRPPLMCRETAKRILPLPVRIMTMRVIL